MSTTLRLNGTSLRVRYADSSPSRGGIVARVCDVCGKRRGIGNNVSHANNRTKRSWEPNLQRVHCIVEKTRKTLTVCTRCIRSGKIVKAA